jgi:hypothetical protein
MRLAMRRAAIVVGLAALVLGVSPAGATDQPIGARKLLLRRTGSGQEKLLFVTTDPHYLFPAPGGADDPASGTPGGLTIELVTAAHAVARFDVPAGAGWTKRSSAPAVFHYANKLAPAGPTAVSAIIIRSGHGIRLRASATGLPLASVLGPVSVRITTGGLRSCVRFDATTIRRDANGVYNARNAFTSLSDCADATLGAPTCADGAFAGECGGTCPPGAKCSTRDLSTCECIDSAQPCGDTNPACNGECPSGLECGDTGGFLVPGCGCVPAGHTPCGATSPACDGACPTGTQCYPNSVTLPIGTFSWCECLGAPPVDPCGGCPPGFACAILPPNGQPICHPVQQCSGPSGYPTCDGTCTTGSCQATNTLCVCVP